MGIAYGTEERNIFVKSVPGIVLGPVLGMALGRTQGAEVGSRGISNGKYEGLCVGEINLVNSFCVCFGGSGDGYPLVE